MTDTPVQPSDLREGDEVTVTLKGVVYEIDASNDEVALMVEGGACSKSFNMWELELATITRSPKPLAVGDAVYAAVATWKGKAHRGEIIAVSDDKAWVRWSHLDAKTPYDTDNIWPLSDLQRVSPTQGEDQ